MGAMTSHRETPDEQGRHPLVERPQGTEGDHDRQDGREPGQVPTVAFIGHRPSDRSDVVDPILAHRLVGAEAPDGLRAGAGAGTDPARASHPGCRRRPQAVVAAPDVGRGRGVAPPAGPWRRHGHGPGPAGQPLASFATTINLVVAKNGGLHVVRVSRASPKSLSTSTSYGDTANGRLGDAVSRPALRGVDDHQVTDADLAQPKERGPVGSTVAGDGQVAVLTRQPCPRVAPGPFLELALPDTLDEVVGNPDGRDAYAAEHAAGQRLFAKGFRLGLEGGVGLPCGLGCKRS